MSNMSNRSAERLAEEAWNSKSITPEMCLQILQQFHVPASDSRKKVMPKGTKRVPSMTLGLYARGNAVNLTSATTTYPWCAKFFAAFGQTQRPQFPFTSIQVNINFASAEHTDINLGASLIHGLGDYTGGELFVEDPKGPDEWIMTKCAAGFAKGQKIPGWNVDIKGRWFEFDGKNMHAVRKFTGHRYTLIYFVTPRYMECAPEVRMSLGEHGFAFLWSNPLLQVSDPQRLVKDGTVTAKVKANSTSGKRKATESSGSKSDVQKAVKAAYALLQVNSNQKGGGGVALFRTRMAGLRRAVKELPEEMEFEIVYLLDAAESRDNFEAKTPGSWRRFLLPILELLGEDLDQVKPGTLSTKPVKNAQRRAKKRLLQQWPKKRSR